MPPADPYIGREILGQFRILERVGSGGMGAVYKAEQPSMDRLVAVKILHPKLASRKDLVSRFRREARAMSHLTHPNTVRVFLYGQLDDGSLYIVMEFLAGKNLAQFVRADGPLSFERALPVMIQACGALEEAHRQGIVHRDLKPENIFLCTQGGITDYAKVLDFGLAKVTEREMRPGSLVLTQEGMVFGTPEFMSPEQAQGKTLDPRSDIYSLGVILYELLTGKLPFSARVPMEYISLHVNAIPIPLKDRAPTRQFPVGLQDVMDRALAKNPDDRYQTAAEFATALKAVLPGGSRGSMAAIPPPQGSGPGGGGGGLGASSGGASTGGPSSEEIKVRMVGHQTALGVAPPVVDKPLGSVAAPPEGPGLPVVSAMANTVAAPSAPAIGPSVKVIAVSPPPPSAASPQATAARGAEEPPSSLPEAIPSATPARAAAKRPLLSGSDRTGSGPSELGDAPPPRERVRTGSTTVVPPKSPVPVVAVIVAGVVFAGAAALYVLSRPPPDVPVATFDPRGLPPAPLPPVPPVPSHGLGLPLPVSSDGGVASWPGALDAAVSTNIVDGGVTTNTPSPRTPRSPREPPEGQAPPAACPPMADAAVKAYARACSDRLTSTDRFTVTYRIDATGHSDVVFGAGAGDAFRGCVVGQVATLHLPALSGACRGRFRFP